MPAPLWLFSNPADEFKESAFGLIPKGLEASAIARWLKASTRARAIYTRNLTGLAEIVQQRLRLFEIWRIETLGEPAVDWREKVARFGGAILPAVEPSEAHCGPQ